MNNVAKVSTILLLGIQNATALLQRSAGSVPSPFVHKAASEAEDEAQDFARAAREAAQRMLELQEDPNGLPAVKFVSVNTQDEIALKKYGFPEDVANVGKGQKWDGYGTKLIDIMYHAASLPEDTLLVYVDGNDVVWGGCSKVAFLNAYGSIVEASGANIVIGAEMVCGEQRCENATELPKWALDRKAKGAMLREQNSLDDFVECDSQVVPECRCDMPSDPPCRNFDYTGIDDDDWRAAQHLSLLSLQSNRTRGNPEKDTKRHMGVPGAPFRYLNSGFIMGPAGELRSMFQWAVFHYLTIKDKKTWMHDQGAIAEFWRLNPSRVALDYRGELALSLPRLSPSVLQLSSSTLSRGKIVKNQLLGSTPQCFIHNNVNEWNGGPRANFWWDFFDDIEAQPADWNSM